MAKKTTYQINVSYQDNTLTTNDPNDKYFTVNSQGTAEIDRIVREMMDVNPGLEQENIGMVLELFNRIIIKLLLLGLRINTGLFIIELVCKGVTYNGKWDPAKNSLQISITPTKELREILDSCIINVTGESKGGMTVAGGESAQGAGYRVKAGRAFTLNGKNIKVVGDDPSVGITLTSSDSVVTKIEGDLLLQNDPSKVSSDSVVTKIEGDLLLQNDPSKVSFIVPGSLEDGEYELKIVTQYTSGGWQLKTPRSIVKTLIVGEAESDAPVTSGGDEEEDGPQVQ